MIRNVSLFNSDIQEPRGYFKGIKRLLGDWGEQGRGIHEIHERRCEMR